MLQRASVFARCPIPSGAILFGPSAERLLCHSLYGRRPVFLNKWNGKFLHEVYSGSITQSRPALLLCISTSGGHYAGQSSRAAAGARPPRLPGKGSRRRVSLR